MSLVVSFLIKLREEVFNLALEREVDLGRRLNERRNLEGCRNVVFVERWRDDLQAATIISYSLERIR